MSAKNFKLPFPVLIKRKIRYVNLYILDFVEPDHLFPKPKPKRILTINVAGYSLFIYFSLKQKKGKLQFPSELIRSRPGRTTI